MNIITISGAQLRDMVVAGATLLENNKQAINALNVFPVPDGDTGTNMSMTMASAVHEARLLPDDATVSDMANAVSMGALRGARGNSGVILSQLFRGFSRACKGEQVLTAELLTRALSMGTDAAYKAVMKPKEGTILTVSRCISDRATELFSRGANMYRIFDGMIEEGERALADTPNQLPVLKEAGVVDSGGRGLLTIYRGFKLSLDGEEVADYVEPVSESQPTAVDTDSFSGENITFGYCTEFFIIHPPEAFREEEVQKFQDHLNKLGDSVVVAMDADMVKVHVHSNAPGKVLQMALRLGELDKLKIENMREQNRQIQKERKKNEKEQAMVAVSVGDGLDTVFSELNVSAIISGGQTMNPSIDTIAKTVRKVNARNVFVLPNNSNIILAAQQAAALVDCNVIVLPTKTIPQGVSAAIAFNPDITPEENERGMTEAFGAIVSGAVTYAVRDSKMDGAEVKKGDMIGLMDNHIAVSNGGVDGTVKLLVGKMMEKLCAADATVTLFYGADVTAEQANALSEELTESFPEAEFIVQNGGQPLYYYYISAE